MHIDLFSTVKTVDDIHTEDGIIPANTIGTVVHVHAGHTHVEVEVDTPFNTVITMTVGSECVPAD